MDPDFDFLYDAQTLVRKMNEKLKARGKRQRWKTQDGLELRWALSEFFERQRKAGLLPTEGRSDGPERKA